MPPDENSIHLGSYYQILNSRVGFWNNYNLRFGLYIKELNFDSEELSILDHGVTLGLGIEYLANTQSIDMAFRTGKKGSMLADGEYEKYFSFHIGLTTGERWFMKRRRK